MLNEQVCEGNAWVIRAVHITVTALGGAITEDIVIAESRVTTEGCNCTTPTTP